MQSRAALISLAFASAVVATFPTACPTPNIVVDALGGEASSYCWSYLSLTTHTHTEYTESTT
jgi:hypothetical protein